MKNTNSKTGWIITILILVVVNIATWFTILHIIRKHHPPQNGRDAANFLVKELGFDSIQKVKYFALIEQHQKEVREIKEQAKHSKETFFSLLSDTAITEDSIKVSARNAFESENQIAIKTFHHLQMVRALCNAEQKSKFDHIIQDVIKMMGPQSGPPPHRGEKFGSEGEHRPPPPDDGFPPPPPGENPHP